MHVLASALSYPQAIFIGLLQGITELFPISSLGHSVLVPALFGWHNLVKDETQSESFYLAFLVGTHLATATVLFLFYWSDWKQILKGLYTSVRYRRMSEPNERLGWLLIAGTIPTGLVGLALEHKLRTILAKPEAAALFLVLSGLILLVGERLRKRVPDTSPELDKLSFKDATVIGAAQIGGLFAGISRSGITMTAGLLRGLSHEQAARFAFLLATPIIGLAGLYKIPDLLGPNGDGVRGQILVGSLVAALGSYISIRFLVKYFRSNSLRPFGVYCVLFGGGCAIYFA